MPKYLVMYTQGPNPPAEAADKLATDSMDWLGKLIEDKKVESTYLFPDGGGFAIFDCDGHDDLQHLIHSNPASAYLRHEEHALLDALPALDEMRKGYGETLAQAASITAQKIASSIAPKPGEEKK